LILRKPEARKPFSDHENLELYKRIEKKRRRKEKEHTF